MDTLISMYVTCKYNVRFKGRNEKEMRGQEVKEEAIN